MIFKQLTKELDILSLTEEQFNKEKADCEAMYGGSSIMLIDEKIGGGFMLLPYTHIRQSAPINFPELLVSVGDICGRMEFIKNIQTTKL